MFNVCYMCAVWLEICFVLLAWTLLFRSISPISRRRADVLIAKDCNAVVSCCVLMLTFFAVNRSFNDFTSSIQDINRVCIIQLWVSALNLHVLIILVFKHKRTRERGTIVTKTGWVRVPMPTTDQKQLRAEEMDIEHRRRRTRPMARICEYISCLLRGELTLAAHLTTHQTKHAHIQIRMHAMWTNAETQYSCDNMRLCVHISLHIYSIRVVTDVFRWEGKQRTHSRKLSYIRRWADTINRSQKQLRAAACSVSASPLSRTRSPLQWVHTHHRRQRVALRQRLF